MKKNSSSDRQLRSTGGTKVFYKLEDNTRTTGQQNVNMSTSASASTSTSSTAIPTEVYMEKLTSAVPPPSFSGKTTENAASFLKQFEKYTKYRNIRDDDNDDKKLNLFAVLLKDAAGDWMDSLPETHKDSFTNLLRSFHSRYLSHELVKHRSAK